MDAYCTSGNSPTLEALCEKYGLPVIADLHGFSPQTQAITSIPLALALKLKIIPLSRVGPVLTIIISDPLALPVVDAVRFHTGLQVDCVVAMLQDIEAAIPRFYGVAGLSEPEVEIVEPDVEVVEYTGEKAFNTRADALFIAALNLPDIRRRRGQCTSTLTHRAYWVGALETQPKYEDVIAEALKALQDGGKK